MVQNYNEGKGRGGEGRVLWILITRKELSRKKRGNWARKVMFGGWREDTITPVCTRSLDS